MRKLPIALVMSALLGGVPLLAVQSVSAAEESAENSQEEASAGPRVRRTMTLREIVFEKPEEAQQAADAGNFDEALQTLERLEKRKRNSYERAMTHNMYAYVYSTQENYAAAIPEYAKVIEIDNAPDSLKQTTRYTLAKLYMLQERYAESLATINEWMSQSDKVNADAYMFRAQVQYQQEKYYLLLPALWFSILF